MKRFIPFFLACTMLFSSTLSTFATSPSTTQVISSETSQETDTSTEQSVQTASTQEAAPVVAYYTGDSSTAPDVVAGSAVLMDAKSGTILYAKEGDTTRYPASITKVMTALIAIERCQMDDIITFSSSAVNGIEAGSSTAGINVGAQLTVEDTLYALMLVSANEAGAAIAEHIAGSDEAFAQIMTERARELGCTGTQFKNPHGLPNEEHYTTAHDMALIMKQALQYEEFRKISGSLSYTVESSDTLNQTLELWNHAKLLYPKSEYYYEYAEGAKTGFTQAALNTLVTFAKKDDIELICVVLKDSGANNSYYDSAHLYDWGFSQVKYITPLMQYDLSSAIADCKELTEEQRDIYKLLDFSYEEDLSVLVASDFDESSLTCTFSPDEDKKNGIAGSIEIQSGETSITSVPVTFDTSTATAKAYISGVKEENSDNLETAPVDGTVIPIGKVLAYLGRIIVAIAIVFIVMTLVRRHEMKKLQQKNAARRRKRRAESLKRNDYRPKKKPASKK